MSMIIDNSTDGSNFTPDTPLDTEREYEGRIVGMAHVGLMENQDFDDNTKVVEIEQAIILIELTEEDTYVPRGAEGEEVFKPRVLPKFIKYSSHEKSGLYALAKTANKKAAWVEGKKGMVNPELILDEPVSITIKDGKDGKQNISKINPIMEKHKAGVEAKVSPTFLYDIDTGAHAGTTIEDVPAWIIKYAMNKALNVESFGQLEEMEAYVKSLEDSKEGGKLDGDDKPKDSKKKAPPKKVEEKKVDKVEKDADGAGDEEKPAPRRSRRSRGTPDSTIDYSTFTEAQLEDALEEKGVTSAEVDDISDSSSSDDDYLVRMIAKLQSL